MMMDRTVVGHTEPAGWQGLIRPLGGHCGFVFVERRLIANVRDILENGRAGIAVGIGYRVIHVRSMLAAEALRQCAPPLVRRQTPAIEIPEIVIRAAAQTDSLDRADLGEIPASQDIRARSA